VKRMALLILAALLLAVPLPISAQDDVDIAATGEQVTAVDSERLLMRLNTPIPEDLLAEPFSEPSPLNKELLAEQRAQFDEALPDLRGSAVYTVTYTPESSAGMTEASPTASPTVRGSQRAFSSGTLFYLLFDDPVDASDIDAFGARIQEALGTDAQAGSVEEITVSDAAAVLVSSVTVVNAIEFHTEWIAIPVGDVVVVAMITEGSDTFDEGRFRNDNEALALSGIAYLQRIIDDMMAS
jgi:hypothetical protein